MSEEAFKALQMTPDETSEILRFTQDDPGSVTLSDSEESLEICKMTERGLGHRSVLSPISRMKNGISWPFYRRKMPIP